MSQLQHGTAENSTATRDLLPIGDGKCVSHEYDVGDFDKEIGRPTKLQPAELEHDMARKSIEERLAQLEAQKKALKARLGKEERTKDTRRKVLLGALVMHRLENGKDEFSRGLGDWLRRELPGFLTRDGDQELFDDLLKPKERDAGETAS